MIVVLTGRVCSGKSTLSGRLAQFFGFHEIRTKDLILRRLGPQQNQERRHMQDLGEQLDAETNGCWTRDDVIDFFRTIGVDARVVIDAPRSQRQVEAIRDTFGNRVIHIHLDAPLRILAQRYKLRVRDGFEELATYGEVQENKTEAQVHTLAKIADMVLQTKDQTEEEVFLAAITFLGLEKAG